MNSNDSKKPLPTRLFILAMMKHLPPSGSTLRLFDWAGGALAMRFAELRGDIESLPNEREVDIADNSIDAIVVLDDLSELDFLPIGLRLLRPGGRLIAVDPNGEIDPEYVKRLEAAGYTRILVEAALDPLEHQSSAAGVLVRGEKPHITADTLQRIRGTTARDEAGSDGEIELTADVPPTFAAYRGRYVYFLVRQTPNKPIWARAADEPVEWMAASSDDALLAFSSLPRTVAFMQVAVLNGMIRDVNKFVKFRREVVAAWSRPILFNPDAEHLTGREITFTRIDPANAEQPDE